MQKPVRAPVADDLPSIDSDDEEGEDEEVNWSSGIESDSEVFDEDEVPESDAESIASGSSHPAPRRNKKSNVDEEMPYENLPRKRRPSWEPESDKDEGIERLPIKLANGRVQKTSEKVHIVKGRQEREPSDDESEDDVPEQLPTSRIEDVSTGARFGRPAVVDVIGNKSRKARIQGAKEQIASICQEIVADPETSIGLLRRLHTFSLLEISTPSHPEPVPNDVVIRRLTILSQLSVFKDIIPGYRIRALTDKEKAEKVSQMVQRTRDWEQGLVGVYQLYLRTLEAEVKAKSELAETALYCMCTLLVELTHFNFRVNLMNCIVANLSRKSWDKTSDLCLNSIIKVFRADNTGVPSLELVRILNRMVKERMFNVHPEVLSCLLHLRLKTELGVRASETKADKEEANKAHKGRRGKGKGKAKSEHVHLSKKAKKVLQERKEIEKEMREAEAEVDKEERAVTQTETLKLLFVLYFRILKNPHPTPLLPAALQGISKFSHLVNIDFFKDLLKVLKELMARQSEDDEDASLHLEHGSPDTRDVQHQLLCIVTAFELLSGQGEALDIDLTDFINWLYTILPSLALMPDLETAPTSAFKSDVRVSKPQSTADMLFRALDLVFIPRTSASAPPPWRSAAFAKRLLACALHWSPATAARAMDFVGALVERDSKLGALLSTEDRSVNGVYRPDLDDPQLSNPFGTSFWELLLLSRTHWVAGVVDHARKLLATTS
ncbi:nucleolar complex-associated protein 3 [Obba rivulosa]|uniref:Nucleolar complex-associated protein 3 n=1 Tax=Obba rivulosa TaxID=1052685 RepID=A0A8E2J7S4_9APHY|nr:nucleolar complex-associated protein 3 [Obba rivulosa]